jgi:transketolase
LRHDPTNPHWADRDRFVLSNGHGSMLQYALLHLSGDELPMAELQRFSSSALPSSVAAAIRAVVANGATSNVKE